MLFAMIYLTGVGKLRPAGRIRPARVYYAARANVGEVQTGTGYN